VFIDFLLNFCVGMILHTTNDTDENLGTCKVNNE